MGRFRRARPFAFCGRVFYLSMLLTRTHGAVFQHSLEYAAIGRQLRIGGAGPGSFSALPAPALSAAMAAQPLAQEIAWVTGSPEYGSVCRHAYALAEAAVMKAAAAETREWTVVLDVDDTVLQSWSYGAELAATGAVDTPESWRRWVRRKEAAPVPGAKEFLEKVRTLGPRAHIAFVTDDEIGLQEDKIETMRKLGLFAAGDLFLSKTGPDDTKESRRRCLREGVSPRCGRYGPLATLATIGDAIRDHVPVRTERDAEFVRQKITQGEFWCEADAACIVLPNPVYGDWTSDYGR